MSFKIDDLSLSVKEVIYIVSAASAFFFSQYSLKMELREFMAEVKGDKKITELKLELIGQRLAKNEEQTENFLSQLPKNYAIKPREIKVPSYEDETK